MKHDNIYFFVCLFGLVCLHIKIARRLWKQYQNVFLNYKLGPAQMFGEKFIIKYKFLFDIF